MTKQWYALYTHPRTEKKVAERLTEKNIEIFLPLQKKIKQWKDRKKLVEEPLIRSYIFVKIDYKEYLNVLTTPGIVRFITFKGIAAPIPEKQINAIKLLLETDYNFEIRPERFKVGEKIRVISGVLTGLEGELISIKNTHKVLIRIEHIEYNMIIDIPLNFIELIR